MSNVAITTMDSKATPPIITETVVPVEKPAASTVIITSTDADRTGKPSEMDRSTNKKDSKTVVNEEDDEDEEDDDYDAEKENASREDDDDVEQETGDYADGPSKKKKKHTRRHSSDDATKVDDKLPSLKSVIESAGSTKVKNDYNDQTSSNNEGSSSASHSSSGEDSEADEKTEKNAGSAYVMSELVGKLARKTGSSKKKVTKPGADDGTDTMDSKKAAETLLREINSEHAAKTPTPKVTVNAIPTATVVTTTLPDKPQEQKPIPSQPDSTQKKPESRSLSSSSSSGSGSESDQETGKVRETKDSNSRKRVAEHSSKHHHHSKKHRKTEDGSTPNGEQQKKAKASAPRQVRIGTGDKLPKDYEVIKYASKQWESVKNANDEMSACTTPKSALSIIKRLHIVQNISTKAAVYAFYSMESAPVPETASGKKPPRKKKPGFYTLVYSNELKVIYQYHGVSATKSAFGLSIRSNSNRIPGFGNIPILSDNYYKHLTGFDAIPVPKPIEFYETKSIPRLVIVDAEIKPMIDADCVKIVDPDSTVTTALTSTNVIDLTSSSTSPTKTSTVSTTTTTDEGKKHHHSKRKHGNGSVEKLGDMFEKMFSEEKLHGDNDTVLKMLRYRANIYANMKLEDPKQTPVVNTDIGKALGAKNGHTRRRRTTETPEADSGNKKIFGTKEKLETLSANEVIKLVDDMVNEFRIRHPEVTKKDLKHAIEYLIEDLKVNADDLRLEGKDDMDVHIKGNRRFVGGDTGTDSSKSEKRPQHYKIPSRLAEVIYAAHMCILDKALESHMYSMVIERKIHDPIQMRHHFDEKHYRYMSSKQNFDHHAQNDRMIAQFECVMMTLMERSKRALLSLGFCRVPNINLAQDLDPNAQMMLWALHVYMANLFGRNISVKQFFENYELPPVTGHALNDEMNQILGLAGHDERKHSSKRKRVMKTHSTSSSSSSSSPSPEPKTTHAESNTTKNKHHGKHHGKQHHHSHHSESAKKRRKLSTESSGDKKSSSGKKSKGKKQKSSSSSSSSTS